MGKEFLDDYAKKLLEVHDQPTEILNDGALGGSYEPIFWLNDERMTFKAVEPAVTRQVYGIHSEPLKEEIPE